MASEDAPVVADAVVEPDGVMADMHAASSALREASAAESTFLRSWSEPDQKLFHKFVAEQEALHKDLPLTELNDKVARQTRLLATHTADKCVVVAGKLSLPASLHATLKALRKCQTEAMSKAQDEEAKLHATSSSWYQVRGRLRFRAAWCQARRLIPFDSCLSGRAGQPGRGHAWPGQRQRQKPTGHWWLCASWRHRHDAWQAAAGDSGRQGNAATAAITPWRCGRCLR